MKKILTIDGGGMKGIIPASWCVEFENLTGKAIWEMFDLIAGTSTGGILAAGLACLYTAEQMLHLYVSQGGRIFSERQQILGFLDSHGITDEKWKHEPLEEVLKEYFGRYTLGEARTKLMISTYDLQNEDFLFFKSWRHDISIAEACRATSAAPVFFEAFPFQMNGIQRCLLDGGLIANNPSIYALIEAYKLWGADDMLIVNLGTGFKKRGYSYEEVKDWGAVEWLPVLFKIFMGGAGVRYALEHNPYVTDFCFDVELEYASDDMDDGSDEDISNLVKDGQRMVEESRDRMLELCDWIN